MTLCFGSIVIRCSLALTISFAIDHTKMCCNARVPEEAVVANCLVTNSNQAFNERFGNTTTGKKLTIALFLSSVSARTIYCPAFKKV